ncbi:MAG: hypothetical protein IIB62_05780 [Proteobacteria bacterium]|nr:hypothetical protein [Pseudomonadota bacterium]
MTQARVKDSVLILGNYRPTLAVARALGEEGHHVIVSEDDDRVAGARYSRFVDEMWDHPDLDAEAGATFKQALKLFLDQRPDITAIVPVAEEFVVWLAKNGTSLPADITIVSPEARIVELCLDKLRMLDLTSRTGIACAPYAVVKTLEYLYEQAAKIGYPIIVRPLSSLNRLGHKKAIICQDHDELMEVFSTWPAKHPGLLLQRYVSGVRHNLYFIAVNGEIRSLLEITVTRTDQHDGTGLATEGLHIAVTAAFRKDSQRLVRELDYTGIGCIQFVRDPETGEATFLEINPRIAGNQRCAEAVGMPLTRSALHLARGKTDLGLDPAHRYPAGIYFCWLSGDLYGLKEAIQHGEIGPGGVIIWTLQIIRSLLRARIHMMFTWRDPLPPFALLLRHAGRIVAAKFGSRDDAAANVAVPGGHRP